MHCHLDLYPDPFYVADTCRQKGLYVLSVTTTPKSWNGSRKLEKSSERIKTALGLHPQLAHQRFQELELFDALLPQAKYVGEIGLDGGKGFKKHWSIQLKVFRHILKSVSRDGGRIMSIHSCASTSSVLDELERIEGIPVLHWFTGDDSELKRALDIGCWFSVGPAMLNTKKGAELIKKIPKKRVLSETDGPLAKAYGNMLMPWDVERIYTQLSKLWGEDERETKNRININLKTILSSI